MKLKAIAGTTLDGDWGIPTVIAEIEVINEEGAVEYVLLSQEFDSDLECLLERTGAYKTSVINSCKRYLDTGVCDGVMKDSVIEEYGPYRRGLYPEGIKTTKYKDAIKFLQMGAKSVDDKDEDMINVFFKDYEGKDLEDIEIEEPLFWLREFEAVVDDIEFQFYEDEFDYRDEVFIEKFENFYKEAVEKTEKEEDLSKQAELASFLDKSLVDIQLDGKELLDEAIEKFKNF